MSTASLNDFLGYINTDKGNENSIAGLKARIIYLEEVIKKLGNAKNIVEEERSKLTKIVIRYRDKDMTVNGEWKGKRELEGEQKRNAVVDNAERAGKQVGMLISDILHAKDEAEKKRSACKEKLKKLEKEQEEKN